MLDDLTAAELRILDAVDAEGSFSAAAARLGLTQSAVSHSVRGTERKVGAVLFDRGRHGARPTAAGLSAIKHGRGVLRLMTVLQQDVRAASGEQLTDRLRIAAFRSAAAQLLPPALTRLRSRHPNLVYDVSIVRDVGGGTANEVVAGRADVAIVNLPHRLPAEAGLVGGTLLEEPYVLIHPSGHPDPRSLPVIDWTENCSAATKEWFATQEWLPTATINVADDTVLLSMVAHGLGMAVVPRSTAADRPANVVLAELGTDAPRRTVGYVAAPELARSTAVRELVRELRSLS
ncbi:LysR family transcriptional regulator [Kribbella monticola]|uniref:LysR family transcriptional regulator n=1 Tax=Kribbella monticola TaxID=2185285 RepID=UPI001E4939B7|nr:LysR family transcriptional regulator [Kribbella monticola]